MAEQKVAHTPGPWRVDKTYDEPSAIVAADGFPVADVERTAILPDYETKLGLKHWAGAEGTAFIERSDAEVLANARLIAAAPEMLALLCDLITVREKGAGSAVGSRAFLGSVSAMRAVADRAVALLAKIESA